MNCMFYINNQSTLYKNKFVLYRNLAFSKSCKTVAGRHAPNNTPDKITCIVCIVSKDVVQHFNKNAELYSIHKLFSEKTALAN